MLRDKRNMMEGKKHLVLCFDKTLITKELKFMADVISALIRTASVNKNQEKAKDEVIAKLVASTTENIYTALRLDDLSKPHVIAPLTEDTDLDAMIIGSPVYEAMKKYGENNVYADTDNNTVVVPVTLKKVSPDVINAKNKTIKDSVESDGVIIMEPIKYGELPNESRMCDNISVVNGGTPAIDYNSLFEKINAGAKKKKVKKGKPVTKKEIDDLTNFLKGKSKPVVGKKVTKTGREKDAKVWAKELTDFGKNAANKKPVKKAKKEKK